MAIKKFQFVKASIGEILSVNGETLANATKIHAFKEVDTENYIYGWEGDVAGNFHFFNKTSFNLTPKKTINGMLSFTANITDSIYTAEKLTTVAYAYDSATNQFQYDSIKAEDIIDVPTDIVLKSGKLKNAAETITGNKTTPKTANAALASVPTWAWLLIVPAVVYVGYLAIKALTKKKKKVVSK